MKPKWLKQFGQVYISFVEMLKLAYSAQPYFFIGLLLLSSLQAAIPLATALFTKKIFDLLVITFKEGDLASAQRELTFLLLAQASMLILDQVLRPVLHFIYTNLSRKISISFKVKIFTKTGDFQGIKYFENPLFHDTLQLAKKGAEMGPTQIPITIMNILQSLVVLIGFLGILTAFNPILTLLVSVTAFARFYSQIKIGHRRSSLASKQSQDLRLASYYQNILSDVRSAIEIQLFSLNKYFLGEYVNISKRVNAADNKLELSELGWKLSLEVLSAFASSIAFVIVVMQAFLGNLGIGDVTLYTNAVNGLQGSLNGFFYAMASLNEYALYFEHFRKLVALPQPLSVPANPILVPKLESGIKFINVSFRYTKKHPWVLKNLNLHIPAGRCVALVGNNGAGKTTLIKLLTRLYDPSKGQILWDGIDIREFDPKELRTRIGAILQDFVRYELSLRENIGLGNVEYIEDMGRIHRAARMAGISNLIQKLPQGGNTILSRKFKNSGVGVDLSSGEWQKIGAARLFMRDSELLILDEPTASLDAQAEYDLFRSFTDQENAFTSLLISHRFSTVSMADLIAVLNQGSIVEYGSHKELLLSRGVYAKLYNIQAKQFLREVRGSKQDG